MNTDADKNLNHYGPTWGLVGTCIWGLLIGFVFLVSQTLALFIYLAISNSESGLLNFESSGVPLEYNGTVLSICTFASLLSCSLLILAVVKLKKNTNLVNYLGLRFTDVKLSIRWLLMTIGLIILLDVLIWVFRIPIELDFMLQALASAKPVWFLWLALIVAAPIIEEIFFRGFLFAGFSNSFIGVKGAIVVTSLLWAAIHLQYDIYGITIVFILGILFGIARMKTGSVLLPMLLHAMANLLAIVETSFFTGAV